MTTATIIPLSPVASQVVSVLLGSQRVRMKVFQKRPGLFMDLYVNDALLLPGIPCRDRVFMVRDAYLNFQGDLAFEDQAGTDDPYYTGLGDRFLLTYWPPP